MTDQRGFTLVELLAVMIILSVMLAIAVPKYLSLNERAEENAIQMAIVDLNGRELGTWTNLKGSNAGDEEVFKSCEYGFTSAAYSWVSIDSSGGVLQFKETTVTLKRETSTMYKPAKWTLE